MSVPAENLGLVAHPADDSTLVALHAPESMAADQYRLLLRRLDRAAAARPLRTVAVTSCARGEGRSLVAANLALTAAREGRSVVLVEGDLRRPGLASLFELAPRPGLAEIAAGQAELPQALVRVGGLAVVCAGEARDVGAAVRSPRLAATLETLRASFPLVIVDAPPALALADAGGLATFGDGVLLVVRAGATPRAAVRVAVEALADRLVGIVLNGVEEPAYARYLRGDDAMSA